MRRLHSVLLYLLLLVTVLPVACEAPHSERPVGQEESLVFLVRHAERADDGAMTGHEDPHLSEAGYQRARLLAEVLRDAEIQYVYSTDYIRTTETAQPAAELLGVEVRIYDPDDLGTFAATLRATPGRHLVVGHSDTTPELVSALGGDPHGEIESMEYDRLYLVRAGSSGASTVLLRFGASPPPSP